MRPRLSDRVVLARAGGVALLLAATVIAYLPALGGGLLWDDQAHITPPHLRGLEGLYHIWFTPGWTQQYYPLLHSVFWLEWQLWRDNTFAYHIVNVLQHVVAAVLFWRVLRTLRVPGAFLAAATFALHPVNAESVGWITEQKNTLSAIFYLAAAWCYLRFDNPDAPGDEAGGLPERPSRWYVLALTLFILGLLTKTVVATLPAALLVVLWWKRGSLDVRRNVAPLLPWFALGGAAGLVTAWVEKFMIGAEGAAFDLGLLERTLLAGRVVWFYLSKLFWPADLAFFYPRWQVDAAQWTWWASLAGLIAVLAVMLAASMRAGSRSAARAPLAAMLLFGGTLLPVLGFLDVYPFRFSYVADHFQYLAQLGIIAIVAGALASVAAAAGPLARTALLAGAVCIPVVLGWRTWTEAHQYGGDAIHHYQSILERNPEAWIAYNNWADALIAAKDHRAAVPLLRAALELHPEYFEAHLGLGRAYEALGRGEEALLHFERAAAFDNDAKRGQNTYGKALVRAKRVDEGIIALERAVAIAEAEGEPIDMFHLDLGSAYLASGRLEDAVTQLRRARQRVAAEQPLPPVDAFLSDALVRLGRRQEAEPYLRHAVATDPNDAIHRVDLARLLYDRDDYAEARRLLTEAIRLRPDLLDAYLLLALTHHAERQYAEAAYVAAQALDVARQVLDADGIGRVEQLLAPVFAAGRS
jgi:tetratricopeptide (TPR) repeat protein